MTDIHCHILPGVDDGSENLEESLAMAKMAVASGVRQIVATPHFPGTQAALEQLPLIIDRFQLLGHAITRKNLPLTLYPGAEILCMPETAELARQGKLPTIGKTNYLLTEFYFDEPLYNIEQTLTALTRAGYRPVIAHPERYKAVQQHSQVPARWFSRGYVLQLNKGSLLGTFGSRVQATATGILESGLAHIIASDAHSSSRRTPHMEGLVTWLNDRCDPDYTRILLEENPRRLVEDREMVPVP